MIKEFVKAWDKNNKELLEEFEKKAPESYEDIVRLLVKEVINPYLEDEDNKVEYPLENGLDIENMTVIDDGEYQGTTIYVIPCNTYQPSIDDYYMTHNDYGSCSGCDTFLGIESDYLLWDEENADIKGAAKDYHTLALHLLQRFQKLGNEQE